MGCQWDALLAPLGPAAMSCQHTRPGPRQPRLPAWPLTPPAHAARPAPQNPFGAAKPREAVIAEKLGKTEEEVLKEEVSKEKLHVSGACTRRCRMHAPRPPWLPHAC